MNMYKASFETEQNYPYNYNIYTTTTKKIHIKIQFIIIIKKYICIQEKMKILLSPRRIVYYYYIIS